MNLTRRNFAASRAHSLVLIVIFGFGFLVHVAFANALGIHHIFAEVDHDGHEHSDFDLCQWVQQHTCGSLAIDPPVLESQVNGEIIHVIVKEIVFSSQIVRDGGSRAPPPSSL